MSLCSLWNLTCLYSSLGYVSQSITPRSSASTAARPSDGTIAMPAGDWISPPYPWFFQYPLQSGPVKTPKYTYHPDDPTQPPIDYYEIEVKTIDKQVYPNLPKTEMTAYDGEHPGPVFKMERGRESVVRFTNKGQYNMSVHVHGQYNRAPFDGWAEDTAEPGQYKDYYYPNSQNARTAWFHDHTAFTTGEHAYRGQTGSYIITDSEEQNLNLPKENYDIGLALEAKIYNTDASLRYDTNDSFGLWGDVIQVNGQPWPYLKVEPRKYRFRILNGAISRTFDLFFAQDEVVRGEYRVGTKKALDFDVIASDAGLLSHPVNTSSIQISNGERYEIIADFSDFANTNLTLRNQRGVGEIDYAATDMVMRFVVSDTVSDQTNNGPLPSVLRNIPSPPDKELPDKSFTFGRTNGTWVINGVGFADVKNRILARPLWGEDQIWTLTNGDGGGTHPVHIHMVDFRILSRTGGRDRVLPYENAGMKDVVWLAAGETVRVLARYSPWNGVYMFHCHNLVHEDHDMLVAFNVTNLRKWGYNDTSFINPLQYEFRPKAINSSAYAKEAIMERMGWFYRTDAYDHGNVARR